LLVVQEENIPPLPPPDTLPPITVWENVSVADKYAALMYTRQIREGWDQTIREHEDAWDSKLAVRKRAMLVRAACDLLADAFVDPETREAKQHEVMVDISRRMQMMRQMMARAFTPAEFQDPHDDASPYPPHWDDEDH
jgi:hypothetical protein